MLESGILKNNTLGDGIVSLKGILKSQKYNVVIKLKNEKEEINQKAIKVNF